MRFSLKSAKIALLLLFLVSRFINWTFRPVAFTEITYSYMPYAHLWASGVQPYLEQWYEYPPATIPLFYLPHLFDMASLNQPWHLNYLQAYRLELLLIDVGIFSLLWATLQKRKVKPLLFFSPLVYYILATTKAHDFIYDTMDLAFAGAITLGVTAPELWKGARSQVLSWFGFALAVALKLLNGPLGLVYAIQERRNWKKVLLFGGIGVALVWVVPLLLYRTSLSVMLVFHQIRGLQIDSFGAVLVRTINTFTESEKVIEIYKNYEMTGPLSTEMLGILSVIFPVSIVLFVGYASYVVWHAKPEKQQFYRISFTLGYILLMMIVGKVLSRPFMLWHVPLLALLPFTSFVEQTRFFIASLLAIVVTMTYIPTFTVGVFDSGLLVGIIRSVCFALLFWWWWKHLRSCSAAKKA